MAYTIKEALAQNRKGYHIGNRLILPFRCQLIKVIAEGHIITEMVGGNDIKLQQDPHNTSIYFRHMGQLRNNFSKYEVIKLIACEWDDDLCDMSKHIKLVCGIGEKHEVTIEQPNDDMLFIE
jgi:hypothetical protein